MHSLTWPDLLGSISNPVYNSKSKFKKVIMGPNYVIINKTTCRHLLLFSIGKSINECMYSICPIVEASAGFYIACRPSAILSHGYVNIADIM